MAEEKIALLVEDDTLKAIEIKGWLEKEGYAVLSVASKTDAITAVASLAANGQKVSLLVTDWVLKHKQDGIELIKEMRDKDPKLPVMFISSMAHEFTVAPRFRASGVTMDSIELAPKSQLTETNFPEKIRGAMTRASGDRLRTTGSGPATTGRGIA